MIRPVDLRNVRLLDPSQDWDTHTPGFATKEQAYETATLCIS